MGHQTSNVAPVAALAELIGGLLDPGMGVYEQGTAGVVVERLIAEALGREMGWGDAAGGFLTSGGTLGNLTALLCARQAMIPEDVWQRGYNGKQYAFMASAEAHYSVSRAVQVMGMGASGAVLVPVNERFQLDTSRLEECYRKAEREGIKIIGVVASSCATATGSYDAIDEIADFCEAKKLWLHVDGAHGACVIFSEKHKHLLKGIERADSVILDFHKMLMTPTLVTAVAFRRPGISYQTFAQKASYLWDQDAGHEWYNLAKRTFELTKSAMSLRVYALWRTWGTRLFAENVERLYALAQTFTRLLLQQPDFEVAVPAPESNIVCFRFLKKEWSGEKTGRVNAEIREKLVREGEYFIVQTRVQGKLYLRTTLMNPFTTGRELTGLLENIRGMR